jgi:hypothetical protein
MALTTTRLPLLKLIDLDLDLARAIELARNRAFDRAIIRAYTLAHDIARASNLPRARCLYRKFRLGEEETIL